jgi:NADH-quinone oxidoreductase subunit J
MNICFYMAAVVAIIASLKAVTGKNAVHALLYLIVSLLAVSVLFFLLGAPFIAAVEVIVYAGAIMVLFVFVIMMLNVGADGARKETALLRPGIWIGPAAISLILLAEMVWLLSDRSGPAMNRQEVDPAMVGRLLFTKYIIAVELAAFLLMAGVVGAYHLGEKEKKVYHRFLQKEKLPA